MTMTTLEEMRNNRDSFLAGHDYESEVETSRTTFKTIFTRDDGEKYFMQARPREDGVVYNYGKLTEEVRTCIVPYTEEA